MPRVLLHRLHLELLSLSPRWVVTGDEDSTLYFYCWAACILPGLPKVPSVGGLVSGVRQVTSLQEIGVGCEARREVGRQAPSPRWG